MISTEPLTQRVTVGRNDDLLKGRMEVRDFNWISISEPAGPIRGEVKIRNRHLAAPATITLKGDRLEVQFDEPQRAVTPGQGAVIYQGDLVIGGGWIV